MKREEVMVEVEYIFIITLVVQEHKKTHFVYLEEHEILCFSVVCQRANNNCFVQRYGQKTAQRAQARKRGDLKKKKKK